MLNERAAHLPAARGFSRKRRADISLPLTGPITLTITNTLSASSIRSLTTSPVLITTVPAISSTSASSTRVSTSPSTSPSISPSVSSSSSSSSTTVLSITAQIPSASAVPSPTPTDSQQQSNENQTNNPPTLGGGAVAAISIGVLVLVAAAAVLIGRRYLARRRQQRRATARWLSGFTAPSSKADPSAVSNQPPMSVVSPSFGDGYAYSGTLAPSRAIEPLAVPPTSYSNIPVTAGLTPPTATTINRATVRCTFVPNLPDELNIVNGEVLEVLQEYDDGWAFCSNSRGDRGMVPLECLGSGSDAGSDFSRSPSSSRRVSSVSGAHRF